MPALWDDLAIEWDDLLVGWDATAAGAQTIVEMAFGVDPLTDPADVDWIDVSRFVRGISTKRGRSHELDRSEAGTLTLRTANTGREFDPSNTAGPYYPDLLPMCHVRVRAVIDSEVWPLFRGYVEDWGQGWQGRPLGRSGPAEVAVLATDGFKLLNLAPLAPYSPRVLEDAPLGLWRLDELTGVTAGDSAGHSGGPYNGTYQGGYVLADAGPFPGCGPSTGFPYNAGADVDLGMSNDLKLLGDQTWEALIYFDALPSATAAIIALNGWFAFSVSVAHKLVAAVQMPDGSVFTATSTTALAAAHTWYHVAVVKRARQVFLYLKGVDVSPTANTSPSGQASAGAPFHLYLGDAFFGGRIAYAALYDYALDASRISTHAAANIDELLQASSGAQIGAVLDIVGWPAGLRAIDAGSSDMQAHTPEGSSLDELLTVAEDSERGLFLMDAAGVATFHERQSIFTGHAVPLAVFGDSETLPEEISGLVLWLDAAQIPGLADGAAVATWPDSSVSGNDATQANAAKRPVFEASRVRGLPLVRFDGADDVMACGTNIAAGPLTIFVVANHLAAGAGDRAAFTTDKATVLLRTAGLDQWAAALATQELSGQAVGPGLRCLTVLVRSAADLDVVTDGDVVVQSAPGYAATGVTRVGDVAGANAEIAEVLVYSRALEESEREQIEAYLGRKWGLAPPDYELPYADLQVRNDDQDLWAAVALTRAGGSKQVAADAVAAASYGPRTLEKSGLLLADELEVFDQATYLLSRYHVPASRPQQLVLRRRNGVQGLRQQLGRDCHFDRVTVVRRPPGGGPPIELDAHIEGIHHDITPTGAFVTTWDLTPADPLNYWLLGDAAAGLLGVSTRLGY